MAKLTSAEQLKQWQTKGDFKYIDPDTDEIDSKENISKITMEGIIHINDKSKNLYLYLNNQHRLSIKHIDIQPKLGSIINFVDNTPLDILSIELIKKIMGKPHIKYQGTYNDNIVFFEYVHILKGLIKSLNLLENGQQITKIIMSDEVDTFSLIDIKKKKTKQIIIDGKEHFYHYKPCLNNYFGASVPFEVDIDMQSEINNEK
jgi:hypothetical protein